LAASDVVANQKLQGEKFDTLSSDYKEKTAEAKVRLYLLYFTSKHSLHKLLRKG
jgi:hypothetical protein